MKRLSSAVLFLALLQAGTGAPSPAPPSLEQIKAEPNAERRARLAIDFAAVAEHDAESAYAAADLANVDAQLKTTTDAMELAVSSFEASHKTPGRSPAAFKYAEQRSRELLKRLTDLQRRMDAEERGSIDPAIARIQAIHDGWFEGLMGRGK